MCVFHNFGLRFGLPRAQQVVSAPPPVLFKRQQSEPSPTSRPVDPARLVQTPAGSAAVGSPLNRQYMSSLSVLRSVLCDTLSVSIPAGVPASEPSSGGGSWSK